MPRSRAACSTSLNAFSCRSLNSSAMASCCVWKSSLSNAAGIAVWASWIACSTSTRSSLLTPRGQSQCFWLPWIIEIVDIAPVRRDSPAGLAFSPRNCRTKVMAPGAWRPQYKYVVPIDIDLCSKVNGLGCPILTGDLAEFLETLCGFKCQLLRITTPIQRLRRQWLSRF